jgi:hypothetical protein
MMRVLFYLLGFFSCSTAFSQDFQPLIYSNLRTKIRSYAIYEMDKITNKKYLVEITFLTVTGKIGHTILYENGQKSEDVNLIYKGNRITKQLNKTSKTRDSILYKYDNQSGKLVERIETENNGRHTNIFKYSYHGDTTVTEFHLADIEQPFSEYVVKRYEYDNLIYEECKTQRGYFSRKKYYYDNNKKLIGFEIFDQDNKIEVSHYFYTDSSILMKEYRMNNKDSLLTGSELIKLDKNRKVRSKLTLSYLNTKQSDPSRESKGDGMILSYNNLGVSKIDLVEGGRIANTYVVVYNR